MKSFIDEIYDALFLIESGDSSFTLGPTNIMHIGPEHVKRGITDHREYDLDSGAGGKLIIYKRNGAYEIHHEITHGGEQISGKIVPNNINVHKFYGTMKMVGTKILDAGFPLKIVGNHKNGMFQHYNRMAHIFAKKNKHIVSPPAPHNVAGGEDYSEITIRKATHISPIQELYVGITSSTTKHQILGYNGIPKTQTSEIDEIMKDLL